MGNMDDLYYKKYIKYKLKYLELKNGGSLFGKNRKQTLIDKFYANLKVKFNLFDKNNIVISKLNKYKYYNEDKQGKKIKKKILDKQIAENKDLSGLRIKENHETNINLDSYNLSDSLFGSDVYSFHVKFNKSTFNNVNFSNSKHFNTKFKNTKFINTNLSNTQFITPDIDNCEFTGSNLTQSNFESDGSEYKEIFDMENTKLKIINSKFKNVILKRTQFAFVPIVNCDFSNNKLGQTVFISKITDSQFNDNTFNGCIFGSKEKNYKNDKINRDETSIELLKCNFTNSKFNTSAFFNVIIRFSDFTNVNSNDKKILISSCRLFNCKNIFNLINNSTKEAAGFESNQNNIMRNCDFSNNMITDNILFLFEDIVDCKFDDCDFTNITSDYKDFRRCKFDSKFYKNLKGAVSEDDKHEIVNPKNNKNNSNDWTEVKDPKTGKTYYWNKKINKTQWNKPY